jgi:PilZ domain-containing protein
MNFDSSGSSGKTGKQQAPTSSQNPAPAPAGPRPSPATASAPARAGSAPQERGAIRASNAKATLELKTDGSTIRTWATFTDLRTAGCYVEIMTTFPVGTKMELQLGRNGLLVNGAAIVRATYPSLGMGIEFTNLSENAREQLDAMIASLVIRKVVSAPQKIKP